MIEPATSKQILPIATLFESAKPGERRKAYSVGCNGGYSFQDTVLSPNRSDAIQKNRAVPHDLLHSAEYVVDRERFNQANDVVSNKGFVLRSNLESDFDYFAQGSGILLHKHDEFDDPLKYGVFDSDKIRQQMQRFYSFLRKIGPGAERFVLASDPRMSITWNGGDLPLIKGGASLLPIESAKNDPDIALLADAGDLRFSGSMDNPKPFYRINLSSSFSKHFTETAPSNYVEKVKENAEFLDEHGYMQGSIMDRLVRLIGKDFIKIELSEPHNFIGEATDFKLRQYADDHFGTKTLPFVSYAAKTWKSSLQGSILTLAPGFDEVRRTIGAGTANEMGQVMTAHLPYYPVQQAIIGTPEES